MTRDDGWCRPRPEWLQVPAADPTGPAGGVRAGVPGPARLVRFAAVADGAPPSAIELLGLAPWLDPSSCDCELLDPGTANGLAWFAGCQRDETMDKHRLDVALSVGRHAAERARLAGRGLLIGTGQGPLAPDPGRSPGAWQDPYLALGRQGSFALAALVGMAVAAAQMGMPVLLQGRAGRLAAGLAVRLHPGVAGWLLPAPDRSRVAAEPRLTTNRRQRELAPAVIAQLP